MSIKPTEICPEPAADEAGDDEVAHCEVRGGVAAAGAPEDVPEGKAYEESIKPTEIVPELPDAVPALHIEVKGGAAAAEALEALEVVGVSPAGGSWGPSLQIQS